MPTYVLIRHRVMDYSVWKLAYDAHLPKRLEAGLAEQHLFRSANDANEVIILFEARYINRAKTFFESPELRERMEKAGVIDMPDIYFRDTQKVESGGYTALGRPVLLGRDSVNQSPNWKKNTLYKTL